MAGYFGTEQQQRLQAAAEARVPFINATPGACQNGRMLGCDDLDRFGWDRIGEALARDGALGFRLIPAARVEELRTHLVPLGYRFDVWDVFIASAAEALPVSEGIVARGLPDGLTDLPAPTDAGDGYTQRIQAVIAASGVVPFSGSLLVGALGPARTVAIGNDDGAVVAAAHTYLAHNGTSPYRRHAWGGLVAVAESERGRGLGTAINARMVLAAFRDLGASHVYELVSASNAASRRMVMACGLHHDPGLACGIAMPTEAARFTR